MKKGIIIVLALLSVLVVDANVCDITQPTFPGGNDSLVSHLDQRYCKSGFALSRFYTVTQITIDQEGNLSEWHPVIRRDIKLRNESFLYSNMPKWIPATVDGKPVEYNGYLLYDGKKHIAKLLNNDEFQLFKRVPVVRWHPDEDAYFRAAIDAAFIHSPEYLDINIVNRTDTLFTLVNNVSNTRYTCYDGFFKTNKMDKDIIFYTDSIFFLQLKGHDRRVHQEIPFYEYYGKKENGYYRFGWFKGGKRTYSFAKMIKKAFGSIEGFKEKLHNYYYNSIYGGNWEHPDYPLKRDIFIEKPKE